MSAYTGRQGKGAARTRRATKRAEAQARQASDDALARGPVMRLDQAVEDELDRLVRAVAAGRDAHQTAAAARRAGGGAA